MDNHNSISYADNWTKASEPVRYQKPKEVSAEKENKKVKKTSGRPLLTVIQIIICLLIVLTAFVLKTFGSDLYNTVRNTYETEINNEIILNPYENSLDKLLNAAEN